MSGGVGLILGSGGIDYNFGRYFVSNMNRHNSPPNLSFIPIILNRYILHMLIPGINIMLTSSITTWYIMLRN